MNFSLFSPNRRKSSSSPSSTSSSSSRKCAAPRFDRSNASRYIDYELDYTTDTSVRSVDRINLRINGAPGVEVQELCHSLGFSSPDDFAVNIDDWIARRDAGRFPDPSPTLVTADPDPPADVGTVSGGGTRGVRPPMLAPPPFRSGTFSSPDDSKTAWDLVRSFGPHLDGASMGSGVTDEDDVPVRSMVHRAGGDAVNSWSFTSQNDDDCSSTTTEGFSPNVRCRWWIGAWQKGEELGRGSFGTVHKAIAEDGGFFAVKEVSLINDSRHTIQSIEQLEQEIKLLSQFEHEHIVRYLGTEKNEDKFYIFLELVTQGSIVSLYNKYALHDSQVSSYTRQILHGLKYLHDKNVVHRDIKCANILVDSSGSAKIADFGLAKQTDDFEMLKSCRGSIYWMAPEVVQPGRSYGTKADIWSLGCTVLEMLTGKLPYSPEVLSEQNWVQTFYSIGKGEKPTIPDSLSPNARDFINRCIQVDPNDRPSAAELLDHPFVKRQLFTFASPGTPFSKCF